MMASRLGRPLVWKRTWAPHSEQGNERFMWAPERVRREGQWLTTLPPDSLAPSKVLPRRNGRPSPRQILGFGVQEEVQHR